MPTGKQMEEIEDLVLRGIVDCSAGLDHVWQKFMIWATRERWGVRLELVTVSHCNVDRVDVRSTALSN
jgi:hypothetical protein